jgi:PAS domain S-box-containing protein
MRGPIRAGGVSNTDSFDKVARSVLDNLHEGCQVIDREYRYLYVNEAVAKQGQRTPDQLLGRTMLECYPGIENAPFFSRLRACMTERVHDRMENEFQFPDGTTGWFQLRFVPVPDGVCILSLDITEDKRRREQLARTEEQLRHAQKMEAVGRLAGGVAHDFNNILSVILSLGEFVLEELQPGDPMRDDVEEIGKAGRRAADLTRQLLTFSRQQVLEPRNVDLNETLANMDRMLQRILGADIDLVTRHAKPLGLVRVDPGHIEQVIMNLVVNARDAMPTGGKLTIETANATLDEGYSRDHLGVAPGPHVMLAITDTGIGMDKDTLGRIFEPFFTTKQTGKGTGLGLSTVFGIVQQSGGSVWVYSEPGLGTTFKIYLPVADAHDMAKTQPLQRVVASTGNETILLVEDDDAVRTVARGILVKQGYKVFEARNPGEAIAIAEREAVIDLLVTDVVMPQMSGPELAKRLVAQRPGLKVLCMSGYTDDSIVRHGVIEACTAYLQKPITPESLALRVRQILDGRE